MVPRNAREIDMPDQATDTVTRIVIGVDGSPGSRTALTWAMNQAKPTGATVEAVTAWQDPAEYGTAYGWTSVAFEGDAQLLVVGSRTRHPRRDLARLRQSAPRATRTVSGRRGSTPLNSKVVER
jgi:nucleotide-binding universal stress UspA family protein